MSELHVLLYIYILRVSVYACKYRCTYVYTYDTCMYTQITELTESSSPPNLGRFFSMQTFVDSGGAGDNAKANRAIIFRRKKSVS